MRLLFLGTGTSYGVPMIGCDCDVCRSSDPRDKRTRASVLVKLGGGNVLIDTATELREQALRNGVTRIDAVLFTHAHADHLHGIDDLRRFSGMQRRRVPVYGDVKMIAHIRRSHEYIFSDPDFTLGWGIPRLDLKPLDGPVEICGRTVTPVPIFHGAQTILGYRIGRLAYLTDCSGIPESSVPLLEGLHTLVLDALRERPHPTHYSLPEALAVVERLKPERAYFTHIAHDLAHAATESRLPENVRMAYDGLEVETL